jgi:hypothetical protein
MSPHLGGRIQKKQSLNISVEIAANELEVVRPKIERIGCRMHAEEATAIDAAAIRQRWEAVGSTLDERGRRLFAAIEVRTAGRGALAVVSKITGLARSTINRGEDDLDAEPLP